MPASLKKIRVVVDGQPGIAELSIENEELTEHALSSQPNLRWTFTDASKHFHAYDAEGNLPTLDRETVHVPCSCDTCEGEGFHEIHYYCRICREEIAPGTDFGPHEVTIGVRRSWSVKAKMATWPKAERVSVRFEGAPTMFGVASVHGIGTSHSDLVDVELIGEGPLARMVK